MALSINPAEFRMLPPSKLVESPYPFLCWNVCFGVKKWAEEAMYSGEVAYFYESGAAGQGKAGNTLRVLSENAEAKRLFRLGSYEFIGKDRAATLQCADLLAWHWNTHNKRKVAGRVMRADFKSLIEKRIDAHHYCKDDIRKWLGYMAESGYAAA